MKGIIVDTVMTHMRNEPRAISDISVLLMEKAEVEIDLSFVDPDWYKVKSATGCTGYVPKTFIAIKKG